MSVGGRASSQATSNPLPGLLPVFGVKRLQFKVIIPAETIQKVSIKNVWMFIFFIYFF
jgi:hypothetical protein